jgi:CBS domain-containing protein
LNALVGTIDVSVAEAGARPVGELVTVRGKELDTGATVGDARALFGSASVRLIPVLDAGGAYVGAVLRDALPAGAHDAEPIRGHAGGRPPTATASTPLAEALALLADGGGTRLVVLEDDRVRYRGLLCLRSDRRSLCVDAECHAAP